MSEKEMTFIKRLKQWVIGLAATTICSILGGALIIWQTGIVNAEKINALQKIQDSQQAAIENKASVKMVDGVKTSIETEVSDKFQEIKGQLDIVIRMLPQQNTTYNYKTTNK